MEIFDISLTLSDQLPVWPGDPPLVVERIASMEDGDQANVSRLACGVHIGTHIDAPLHFLSGGETINDIPLGQMIGPAQLVETGSVAAIGAAFLEQAQIPFETKRVLFKTTNSLRWQRGETDFTKDFVAIDESGAYWLAERDFELVGVDYLSVAPWNAAAPTHQVLLKAGVVIVEGLDLHAVGSGEYQLICLPLKLADCEGAPARVILTRGTHI